VNPNSVPARGHAASLRTTAMPAAVLALILAACSGSGSPSGAISQSTSGSAIATQSASVELTPSPSAKPSPEPSDNHGAFSCGFPVSGVATVARAQITDVRVGAHDGYDRVVFEFGNGIPQFTLDEATPPLLKDPSGLQLSVEGHAFWQLVMQGGTKQSPSGPETYDGKTDFTPGFPQLTELIEGGDFEAVSTWYFGLESDTCVRVTRLADPSRLVIDVEH
jgi:hypothetical protein